MEVGPEGTFRPCSAVSVLLPLAATSAASPGAANGDPTEAAARDAAPLFRRCRGSHPDPGSSSIKCHGLLYPHGAALVAGRSMRSSKGGQTHGPGFAMWAAFGQRLHAPSTTTTADSLMSIDRLTDAIASAARTVHQGEVSVEATLEALALAARDSVPGFDLAGISTVDSDGTATTRAISDPLVMKFDELQYSLNEGPCLDALGAPHVVSVPRIRHEQRWPHYVPQVVRLGLRSQMAVKLSVDGDGTLGGINLYSTISDDIDPEAEHIAELFALHAATVLGAVTQIHHLNQAMHTRKVIGQAIGVLMERYGLHEDNAFRFLVRASQNDNIKVRDIAQEIVDRANQSSVQPGAQQRKGTTPPG
jgi:hypothetical protein